MTEKPTIKELQAILDGETGHLEILPSGEVRTKSEFQAELERLINRYSMENGSNTPDFILANYLINCLNAFDHAVNRRIEWKGSDPVTGPRSRQT